MCVPMAISQLRSKRKASGGRYKDARKKKLREFGSHPTLTKIGKTKKRITRARGGVIKHTLLHTDVANLLDPKTKKYAKVKIESVVDNPANRNFIRRNIMNKGAIIKTEKGEAKITNRPSQEGYINAVLVK